MRVGLLTCRSATERCKPAVSIPRLQGHLQLLDALMSNSAKSVQQCSSCTAYCLTDLKDRSFEYNVYHQPVARPNYLQPTLDRAAQALQRTRRQKAGVGLWSSNVPRFARHTRHPHL
jgi:hypothetical protein